MHYASQYISSGNVACQLDPYFFNIFMNFNLLIKIFVISLMLFSSPSIAQESEIYRVVVSFNSICCGPDFKDEVAVKKVIKEFEDKYHIKLVFKHKLLGGREGEWGMCFKLRGISKTAQIELVNSLKQAIDKLKKTKGRSDGQSNVQEDIKIPCH